MEIGGNSWRPLGKANVESPHIPRHTESSREAWKEPQAARVPLNSTAQAATRQPGALPPVPPPSPCLLPHPQPLMPTPNTHVGAHNKHVVVLRGQVVDVRIVCVRQQRHLCDGAPHHAVQPVVGHPVVAVAHRQAAGRHPTETGLVPGGGVGGGVCALGGVGWCVCWVGCVWVCRGVCWVWGAFVGVWDVFGRD